MEAYLESELHVCDWTVYGTATRGGRRCSVVDEGWVSVEGPGGEVEGVCVGLLQKMEEGKRKRDGVEGGRWKFSQRS